MFHLKPHMHSIFHYLRNKELDELYASFALKYLAVGLINIFVPIYLLKLGLGLQDVAVYYLVLYGIQWFMMCLGLQISAKWGVKKAMGIGIFILTIHYILLNYVAQGLPYYIPALVFGISNGIYWAGFNVEFAKVSEKKREGREFSIIYLIAFGVTAFAPLLGAITISKLSFSILFFIVIGLLILSIIPLFFTADFFGDKVDFSFKEIMKSHDDRKAIAYEAHGWLGVAGAILWPLSIYLTLKAVVSLGMIVTITSVIMFFFLYLVGKWSDKNKKKVLKIGVFSHALSWIFRLLFIHPYGLFFANLYSSATAALYNIPFTKISFQGAKKAKKMANYFVFRELHLTLGRIWVLLLTFLTASISWIFILTFFVPFGFLWPLRKKSKT